MFKALLLLIGLMGVMQAGVLDFWNASQAKEAYTKGDYPKASSLYQSLDQTNENVAYNLGNAYYKEKAYDKALEAYQHVKEPSLLPQTLYNIGNTYAQLHQNDKAIAAYESALKLKEDKDARSNLELLKKEQKQNKPSDSNQNTDNQQKSSSKEQPKDSNTSNTSGNSEPQQSDKPSQNEPKNAQDANTSEQQPTPSKPEEKPSSSKHDAQKEADQKSEQQAQAAQADDKNAPISNHEERQWDKILNQRGVNTLMLPLSNKGEKDDTTKPW